MDLKIALIQQDIIWEDRDKNLKKLSGIMESLRDIGYDLIVLPEMFPTGFTMNVKKCAENGGGEALKQLKQWAADLDCVVTGSILTLDNGKYYNRMFWVEPEGGYETYDKRHLFRMGKEHLTMSQGMKRTVVKLKGWRINLQICYDLRFPVWSKNRYPDGEYEYDVLLYVANWPEVRSSAYKTLVPARAIENQSYAVWVNRVGKDGNAIAHTGDTMVASPYGKIISQAEAGKEQVLSVSLSKSLLNTFRKKFTVGLDWDEFEIK